MLTKSGEATTRSAHESFDAKAGNKTRLCFLTFSITERTLSKLTFREKPITAQWFRTSNSQISRPRFSHCAITTAGVFLLNLWSLIQRDSPSYRPRLPLLKLECKPVELWLAKISL